MRNRKGANCLSCRQAKRKCDSSSPCGPCVRRNIQNQCTSRPLINSSSRTVFKYQAQQDLQSSRYVRISPVPVIKKNLPGCRSSPRPSKDVSSTKDLYLQELAKSEAHKFSETDLIMSLCSQLPKKHLCDILTAYYLKVENLIYCNLHPSYFRDLYEQMWESRLSDVQLPFLALIFAILASAGGDISPLECRKTGVDLSRIRQNVSIWAANSAKALDLSREKGQDDIFSIHTFIVLIQFWHSIKEHEPLNFHLKEALTMGRALGLNEQVYKDSNLIVAEMKRRAWWTLIGSDLFQALSLDRPLYITEADITCPFIAHANFSNIKPDKITHQSLDKCTEVSTIYYVINFLLLCRSLFTTNGQLSSDINQVIAVDGQIKTFLEKLPWYFKLDHDGSLPLVDKSLKAHYPLMFMLTSCIHTQRFRMHRLYLYPRNEYCYRACKESAVAALQVYNAFRSHNTLLADPIHCVLSTYNVFSAATASMLFALVEFPDNHSHIAASVLLALNDIKDLQRLLLIDNNLVSTAIGILEKLYDLYVLRLDKQTNLDEENEKLADYKVSLSRKISYIFGGDRSTDKYLNRLSIKYLIDDSSTHRDPSNLVFQTPFQPNEWKWASGILLEQTWNLQEWQF